MSTSENQVVHIDFHGGQIEAVQQGEDIWVSVRRACEHLGVASNGQIEKLKGKEWACDKIILSHDASGRKQEIYMLHVDSLPMWLATIDAGRVAESVRPLLIAYQKEAAQVLRDHFFGAQSTYLIPRTYAAALAEAARLEEERARLEEENEAMRPNAALGEAIANANGHIKIELFAKAVLLDNRHMGRNRMFAYLRNKRILMDGGDSHNLPFQRFIDLGWFVVLEGTRTTGEHSFVTFTTRITPRGQLAIVNMMKRDPLFRAVSVEFKGTQTAAALPPARGQLHLPLPKYS